MGVCVSVRERHRPGTLVTKGHIYTSSENISCMYDMIKFSFISLQHACFRRQKRLQVTELLGLEIISKKISKVLHTDGERLHGCWKLPRRLSIHGDNGLAHTVNSVK